MLKRVAVVGATKTLLDGMRKAAKGVDVEVMPLEGGDETPPGAVALVAGRVKGEEALKAALALSGRHEELLELLAEAIDCREAFTPGNSLRVRDHATRFARALGLSPSDQLTLERAALVRDIGKLRVPNEILLKDGLLTYDEWATLHTHTALGAALLEETGALKDTAEIVHWHHECYDGTGYPDGLEGDQIPYLARAMKILDVYCAMTSPRRYRAGLSSHREAEDHLRSEAGGHFDPDLVKTFLDANVGEVNADA
ncbi:MAG TPA: HD domain-containing protein [Candidatus Hydrogenedentes bacterium]|nr:HD domain-containing protein [Candidatus Hydrogenedentota bacterium]